MVLLLGIFYHPSEAIYTTVEVPTIQTSYDVVHQFLVAIPQYAHEVLVSMLPVIGVFVIFQLLTRNYRKRQVLRMSIGLLYTYVGLVLFLTGVNIGFARWAACLAAAWRRAAFGGCWSPSAS